MMLKLGKLTRIPRISHFFAISSVGLVYRNKQAFTFNNKKTQLILRAQGELQKLHTRKKNKQKQWSTINQQKQTQFRVSLIGLPNTGKSTLFNCLIGESLAIVDKQPGMTRDRRQYQIMDGLVKIIDTPGVEVNALGNKIQNSIKKDIFKQTITAIHQSDLIIVVVDSRKPITSDEVQMIKYLRKYDKNKRLVLACNKAQKVFDDNLLIDEMSRLGIDKMFVTSGQNGTGVFEMLQYINSFVPSEAKENLEKLKKTRVQKFEALIKKLKNQMKALETNKGVSMKEWENDFRKINPDPQLNSDLDYEDFQEFLLKPEQTFSSSRGTQIKNLKMKHSIKICFIGRPNVGKSSLINQILGQERMVVSETPNTTSDSIATKILYKNRKIQLIDTAGLHNHTIQRTEQEYLKKAMYSTMLHVRQSHIVVYVMDAYSAFKIQDFNLIRQAIQEGRPVVIAVNKWQAIKQEYKYKAKNYLLKQIDDNLGHMIHGHPIVFVSAKMNEGIDRMLDSIINTYDKWNTRISTGMLNDWLQKFKKLDNLPKDHDMTLRINYLIQARVRPPHFIFFVNNKKTFKDNYMRFVTQNMAKQFKMDGIPFKLTLRSTSRKQNEGKKKNKQEKPKKASPMKQKMEELKKKYNNFGL